LSMLDSNSMHSPQKITVGRMTTRTETTDEIDCARSFGCQLTISG
jgi:hypothetical protein